MDSRETATLSYDSIVKSLRGAGVSEGDMAKMDLLEVGCGELAVLYCLFLLSAAPPPAGPHVHLSLSQRCAGAPAVSTRDVLSCHGHTYPPHNHAAGIFTTGPNPRRRRGHPPPRPDFPHSAWYRHIPLYAPHLLLPFTPER